MIMRKNTAKPTNSEREDANLRHLDPQSNADDDRPQTLGSTRVPTGPNGSQRVLSGAVSGAAPKSKWTPRDRARTPEDRSIYRQGDVLLLRTENGHALQPEPIAREDGRVVLAHSEVTGHSHAIAHRHAKLFHYKDTRSEDRLLRISAGTGRLVHEEHGTIELPAGDYVVRIQCEWSDEEARRVED